MQQIEIKPGRMLQVQRALKSGRNILIEGDVQEVANGLRDVDRGLKLYYEPGEGVWIVNHADERGTERFVSSFEECDQRIVRRMREISRPGYSFAAELERLDREADRRAEHEFDERIGPHAERLAHALTRDLGRHETPRTKSSRAFVPSDVPGR